VPGSVDASAVAEAVAIVQRRIAALAGPRPVQLVAVTKGFGADAIRAAVAAGCTAIGENYAQELQHKMADLTATGGPDPWPEIHFIGQLQTNKVRLIATTVDVWETVDRALLADEIAKRAPGARVYVQVNTTAEAGKGGCAPDEAAALVEHCRDAGLRVEGLMTVGPTSADPDATSAAFASLAALADRLGLPARSMGMSGDYELAIAHGATHVRIGSALFGPRPVRRARMG
jgi:pyridoxal phosphate enzyme (YggS family)